MHAPRPHSSIIYSRSSTEGSDTFANYGRNDVIGSTYTPSFSLRYAIPAFPTTTAIDAGGLCLNCAAI